MKANLEEGQNLTESVNTSNAFHNTYGTESNTVRITPRKKTENRTNEYR